MVARKSGLGRGLDALIPTGSTVMTPRDGGGTGTGLQEISVSSIDPNPNQPRNHFDEDSLAELSASIKAIGLLQPVLVRPSSTPDRFELIAGERRWRASKRAGLSTIPAIVRVTDDVSSVEQALVENLHRQDLTPLEEAAAYQQLLEDFSMTHEQVAAKVGKSRSAITNSLRLLTLPPTIQQYLAEGRLSAGHAKALLGTPNRALQESLARAAVEQNLTVRGLEEAVRNAVNPGAGSATVIPKPGATGVKPTTGNSGRVNLVKEPGLHELEDLLSEHLATPVTVTLSGKHGKMVVEFADLEDLERIYRLMTEGPDLDE
ncbi:putative chromosome-partitioning protein ParB [Actinomycetes bacterium]|nr:putative chromosome-partitioning protein ParB [Actinomycetes bacterium]